MEETLIDWEKIFEDENPNRTAVIVSPLFNFDNPLVRGTVDSDHTDQYGSIETTRYGHTDGKSFLVIQFKDATCARNFIAKRYIVMWETPFIVIPFQSNDKLIENVENMTFTHPPYYTPIAPERPEDNILNVLNDDCLGEVFKKMEQWDRSPMENVCTRFKRAADEAFVSVYKRKGIWFRFLNLSLTEIEKFIRRYGPSMIRVSLSEEDYKADGFNSILKLMAKNCPNLKKMTLDMSDDSDGMAVETLIEIKPLLAKLTDLSILGGSLKNCNEFIAACDGIEKLELGVMNVDTALPEIKFPKLETCDFSEARNGMLDGFLVQNPQIECLKIPYFTGVIKLISERIPNLRELNIRQVRQPLSINDSVCLKRFKQANISILTSNPRMILGESRENLYKVKNITSLQLYFFDSFDLDILVELTRHLWKLENMGIYCHFQQTLSKDLIKELLRHARKLTILDIYALITDGFLEQDYNEILHIVKNRSNPVGLNIKTKISCDHLGKFTQKAFFFKTEPERLTITSVYETLMV